VREKLKPPASDAMIIFCKRNLLCGKLKQQKAVASEETANLFRVIAFRVIAPKDGGLERYERS
jgi:hypothetical protein